MAALQDLDDRKLAPNREFAHSPQACQPVSFWMGNQGQPFAAVTIHETKAELILRTQCSESNFIVFDVQATQETVLIWGHWLEIMDARGCYCPRPFESLIVLPHLVHPETLRIKPDPKGSELVIEIAKQVNVQQAYDFAFASDLKLNRL